MPLLDFAIDMPPPIPLGLVIRIITKSRRRSRKIKYINGFEVLPKTYTNKETTLFTAVVEKKNNKFTFDLKSKP